MRQYYIYDGQVKKGPFDLEQLKSQVISQTTPVWYEGLQDWALAGDVNELNQLFQKNGAPPPLPKAFQKVNQPRSEVLESFEDAQEILPETKGNRWLIILIILVIVAGLGVAFFFYRK